MHLPGSEQTARRFALLNVLIGITGFTGPAVTGNRDGVVNIRTGKLFGVFGMNWAHASLHLGFGLLGLTRFARPPTRYMRLTAGLFGALTAAYAWMFRGRPGVHMMMGMAVNRPANLVHLTWAALGLLYGLRRTDRIGAGRAAAGRSLRDAAG